MSEGEVNKPDHHTRCLRPEVTTAVSDDLVVIAGYSVLLILVGFSVVLQENVS